MRSNAAKLSAIGPQFKRIDLSNWSKSGLSRNARIISNRTIGKRKSHTLGTSGPRDDYYQWRWGYSAQSVSRFMQAYEVIKVLKENSSPMGDEIVLPHAERVARPLPRLIDDVPVC